MQHCPERKKSSQEQTLGQAPFNLELRVTSVARRFVRCVQGQWDQDFANISSRPRL